MTGRKIDSKKSKGWSSIASLPSKKKKKKERAAIIIQRKFRRRRRARHEAERLQLLGRIFTQFVDSIRTKHRNYWRGVDLTKLNRNQLEKIAKGLDLKATGKKHEILSQIRNWMDQPARAHQLAIRTASTAAEKKSKVKGSVYFWEAFPSCEPQNIRPLRARGITKVATNFDSDAVYAINEATGEAWLCRTGGMCAQIGLCSEVRDIDNFDSPLESKWLINPVLMHALQSDHIVDIHMSRSHATAVSRSGELYVWGDSPHGELGLSNKSERIRPTVVPALETFTCIASAVGRQHTVALCNSVQGEDGALFIWGSNSHGQLGIENVERKKTAAPVIPVRKLDIKNAKKKMGITSIRIPQRMKLPGFRFCKISCGALHTAAVTECGAIFTWGCNDGGRLGDERETTKPSIVKALDKKIVIDVACGSWHTAVIVAASAQDRSCGNVYTWGNGTSGQLAQGNVQRSSEPKHVPIPPMAKYVELVSHVACGAYHTAVQTVKHQIFTWGSQRLFCPLPTRLEPQKRVHGRISSLTCGRTFTAFCVLPIGQVDYDEDRSDLSRPKPVRIPALPIPKPSPWVANIKTPKRQRPRVERAKEKQIEMQKIEYVEEFDYQQALSPMCRLCFKCTGYEPNHMHMWLCAVCKHNKSMHGPRKGPLTEYEAIRKLQGAYRAKRARFFLKKMVENRFQRVYHIEEDRFFYYNTWNCRSQWERPRLLDPDFDVPIRDPDEEPEARAPLNEKEAAIILQRNYRTRRARYFLRKMLEARYVKKLDATTGKHYYYNTKTKESSWEKPKLLGKDEDIGQMKKRKIDEKKIVQAKDLTIEQAAQMIQRRYRGRLGMRLLRDILKGRYKKMVDKKTGHDYYLDSVTGQVSWEKPKLLGSDDIKAKKKRVFNSESEAAEYIQCMFRSRHARKRVRKMLKARFQPILDAKTGKYYYYDRETKKTTWRRPNLLESPKKKQRKPKKKKTKRRKRKKFTPDSAARAIQGMIRTHRARKFLHSLLYDTYEKRLDPTSNHYFYHNKRTGHVSWVKPKVLGDRDIPDDVEAWKRQNLKPRRVFTPESAARAIQGMVRTHKARIYLHSLLYDTYEKHLDPHTNNYFYYNKRTGHVSWVKPKVLGNKDLDDGKPTERRRKHIISDPDEAARILQGYFRTRKARRLLLALASQRFEKVFDPNTERYFYFNTVTQESDWDKPRILGKLDLDDPHVAKASEILTKTLRIVHDETSAAVAIQGLFRLKKAREQAARVAQSKYEKVWDEELNQFYYFDTVTGQSQWSKPKILGRTADVFRTVKSTGEPLRTMTEIEAAIMIQKIFRAKKAFQQCQAIMLKNLEKHYDEEQDLHFYYNPKTQVSSWNKPALLGSKDLPPAPVQCLNSETAAIRIQSNYRRYRCRLRVHAIVRERFQKHHDQDSGLYFYYDTKSGQSLWDKPRLLGPGDL